MICSCICAFIHVFEPRGAGGNKAPRIGKTQNLLHPIMKLHLASGFPFLILDLKCFGDPTDYKFQEKQVLRPQTTHGHNIIAANA